MPPIDELAHRILDRDRFELALGDTLDIKTSIVLVFVTLISAVVVPSLAGEANKIMQLAQLLVLALLVASTVFCVLELYPRDYFLEELPEHYVAWLTKLQTYFSLHPNADPNLTATFSNGIVEMAKERIEKNHKLNKEKSDHLFRAFRFSVYALGIEICLMVSGIAIKLLS